MSPRSKPRKYVSVTPVPPVSASPPPDVRLNWPMDPLKYPLTQLFGEHPDLYPRTHGHEGVDWGAPFGTPVLAVLPWIKAEVSDEGPYGLHITLTHENNLQSIYAHLSSINPNLNQSVESAPAITSAPPDSHLATPNSHLAPHPAPHPAPPNLQLATPNPHLALSGSSGRSTGPHLHLTMLFKGKPFDPLPYFIASCAS
jgi:murein DD-endopeptidase MepM/ murein hydrolase activator NlpD